MLYCSSNDVNVFRQQEVLQHLPAEMDAYAYIGRYVVYQPPLSLSFVPKMRECRRPVRTDWSKVAADEASPVRSMTVEQQYRRRGVAAAMLAQAEQTARTLSCAQVMGTNDLLRIGCRRV